MTPMADEFNLSVADIAKQVLALADRGLAGEDVSEDLSFAINLLESSPCKTLADAHGYLLMAQRFWTIASVENSFGKAMGIEFMSQCGRYLAIASAFIGNSYPRSETQPNAFTRH
ncbi:hypothetical protein OCK02_02115 [Rhizobium sp. TRM96647]|uniref:hypothetical protein n=1 Tax=unclassified Rhizobium TaxID=2613769 RepID=UPI0021E6DF12|nr:MULTISPECIES: hypothetical protein [unclassified Rhizobium]MCV3734984.1 hypothetical protein [Rhizobium sp. TRM96647]MCV3757354.1 hypothetical protein [Rhizobium sp. TRM96650]